MRKSTEKAVNVWNDKYVCVLLSPIGRPPNKHYTYLFNLWQLNRNQKMGEGNIKRFANAHNDPYSSHTNTSKS